MAQPDSPDFEFDIKDLEVEGNDLSTPKKGETVDKESQVGGDSEATQRTRKGQGLADTDALSASIPQGKDGQFAGFSIDELPSAEGQSSGPLEGSAEEELEIETEFDSGKDFHEALEDLMDESDEDALGEDSSLVAGFDDPVEDLDLPDFSVQDEAEGETESEKSDGISVGHDAVDKRESITDEGGTEEQFESEDSEAISWAPEGEAGDAAVSDESDAEGSIAEDAQSEAEDEEEEIFPITSSDELLMQAGGLLNSDAPELDEDAASETRLKKKDGDPSLPPAPVKIIDEEPLEEDFQPEPLESVATEDEAVAAEAEAEPDADAEGQEESDDFEDPYGIEDQLGDFGVELEDVARDLGAAESSGDYGEALARPSRDMEVGRRGLFKRLANAAAIAAGLALVGLGLIAVTWKQEIQDYLQGRDSDGSALIAQIEKVGNHMLAGFGDDGLYRVQWVDSEIHRISGTEIRLHALVGAVLAENLYEPVFDSVLQEKFGYEEVGLNRAVEYAKSNLAEHFSSVPQKPWSSLIRLSARRGEVVPLRVIYNLTRSNEQEDWDLAGIKLSGYNSDLQWPQGRPRYAFEEGAHDVDSELFRKLFADYRKSSKEFVANVDLLKGSIEAEEAMLALENQKRRERILRSFAQGSYFNGVAILGEDARQSKPVTMAITEVHGDGSFVKGVFALSDDETKAKHFIASVDFDEAPEGLSSGRLKITTIAFDDGRGGQEEVPAFFRSNTISRMELKTDGIRLEGDLSDLSLRLLRKL